MYNFSYWAEYEKVLQKSQKEIQGDARRHRYHTFIGEGELERLLKGGSICIRPGNFKAEGGSRKFEKGMVTMEKGSVLMTTVSSLQVTQRDWERSSG